MIMAGDGAWDCVYIYEIISLPDKSQTKYSAGHQNRGYWLRSRHVSAIKDLRLRIRDPEEGWHRVCMFAAHLGLSIGADWLDIARYVREVHGWQKGTVLRLEWLKARGRQIQP